jgi:hypothetical protein
VGSPLPLLLLISVIPLPFVGLMLLSFGVWILLTSAAAPNWILKLPLQEQAFQVILAVLQGDNVDPLRIAPRSRRNPA